MSMILNFQDFGFKIAVINHLMYKKSIIKPPIFNPNALTPKFDKVKFIENARGLTNGKGLKVIEKEGYSIIPEIKEYFENIEIKEEMVQDIKEIISRAGDAIYNDIFPFWDGESSIFDVKSSVDIKLIPNLKRASLLFEYPGEQLINDFNLFGVKLTH